MIFPVRKILLLHFSKLPHTSRTVGKPTVNKRKRVNPCCFQLHPLGILFDTPSRDNIILSGAMKINAESGPHYGREGTKMYRSSQMLSIPFTRSSVSRILREIWYSSTAIAYKGTSRTIWSSWKSPRSTLHTDMSRSRRSLNRRSETLDLRI